MVFVCFVSRQMLARIEFKLEEYLAYLDEAEESGLGARVLAEEHKKATALGSQGVTPGAAATLGPPAEPQVAAGQEDRRSFEGLAAPISSPGAQEGGQADHVPLCTLVPSSCGAEKSSQVELVTRSRSARG